MERFCSETLRCSKFFGGNQSKKTLYNRIDILEYIIPK
jgi:hypothetical protein